MLPSITDVLSELSDTLDGVQHGSYRQALDLLRDAPSRVLVSGQGRSGMVAQMAAMRLMHLGLAAHAVGEPTAPPVREGDILVIISGSGETPISNAFASQAQNEGASVLAITKAPTSTLARAADVTLTVAPITSAQFAGSMFEQAALILLDVIVLDLSGGATDIYAEMAQRHTNLQ
ncbi:MULTISPECIES: SIS domain-containing protein [unclassified Curtobacterium]|uniref:SIS domain-containing protein n=1 Tax=unclassified Curtobacterium TaxID=257496 RepID=UPI00226B9BB2|nr:MULTISPECIES: SIS domain-containing protein [unclassified Curtobacterium]